MVFIKPVSDSLKKPLVKNEEQQPTAPPASKLDLESGDNVSIGSIFPPNRVSTATTVCLFLTALLVMMTGVIGGVYLYKQFAFSQARFTAWCNIPMDISHARLRADNTGYIIDNPSKVMAEMEDLANKISNSFREEFELDLETDSYEKIEVPDFKGGRKGRFIHDFVSNKTGIIDLDGHRCFVMPLDREKILPPRSLVDVIQKLWNGSYEVDTEAIRENYRVVIPPITDYQRVGIYIERECKSYPTYMLEKYLGGVYKRSAPSEEVKFIEFGGRNIMELNIINMDAINAYEANHH